ncbi:flagellar protein FlaG [Pectinatus frisingensis]|uniref:flagellar protein FlaG n=1 Tax=Pectinatus frisingensis TaxID=865 RepID=UPI0015F45C04|nr:flagellar protein FlaG [Pectinatus frisingensis]
MINNLSNINLSNGQVEKNDNSLSLSEPAASGSSDMTAGNTLPKNAAAAGSEKSASDNLSDESVKSMTEKLNKMTKDMNLQLEFVWYKQLDRLGVKMVDINTNKTIKSFPPEEIMNALVRTKEWVGKFLDKEI